MQDKKLFTAKYTDEAEKELKNLNIDDKKRTLKAVALFEYLGQEGVNSRPLNKDGLFEIKTDKVRIYFMYQGHQIIIIGLITLKKTQKAPKRYKIQAVNRINKYIRNNTNENK